MDNILFNEIESIVACWYIMADCNGRSESESALITNKLMKQYHIKDIINWDVFLEKWSKLKSRENIINSYKQSLENADYTSKLISLAGMWMVAECEEKDINNSWTNYEKSTYSDLEALLNIKREDVLAELKSEKKNIAA